MTNFRRDFVLLFIAVFLFGAVSETLAQDDAARRTEGFKARRYGLFAHYLMRLQNNPEKVNSLGKETSWNDCVNEFDVERFAEDAAATGAGYVIFTVMQQTEFMIAPNETFDRLTGFKPGEACSERDLIAELCDALHKRDIDLILYWTGDGPTVSERARSGLKLQIPVTDDHVRNWASVAREYSLRYGKKIKGWWIDGSYPFIGYNDTRMKIMADALRAGNPDAILAFNPGVTEPGPISVNYSGEDFTAGERTFFNEIPTQRLLNGKQWHLASFLGINSNSPQAGRHLDGWGATGCSRNKIEMAQYVHRVNKVGGVVTIDVCLFRDGGIDRAQVETLRGLRTRMKKMAEEERAWRDGGAVPARNAAWKQISFLKSLDGARQLQPSVGEIHAARYGNDGRFDTAAVGSNDWAWNYEVLFDGPVRAAAINVFFARDGYPTECEIFLKRSGTEEWISVGAFHDLKGDPIELRIESILADAVCVKSYKPDGPNQPGRQMAVAELQVFEPERP